MGRNLMSRKRLDKNKDLPPRWCWRNGAIYYQVPEIARKHWDNKYLFRLGKTESEAYATWAEKLRGMETHDSLRTVGDLLDRYEREIVPTKSKAAQYYTLKALKNLRKVFGKRDYKKIEPVHCYKYIDRRSKKKLNEKGKMVGGPAIAKSEIVIFSDVYKKAIKWGVVKKHPFRGQIEHEADNVGDRYVENWELNEFLSVEPKHKKDPAITIQAYVNVKIITGLRKSDLLQIQVSGLKQDGIHITPYKGRDRNGKKIIIRWTDDLRKAVDYALSVRFVDISPYLFCTRRGKSYHNAEATDPTSAFDSQWRRYMKRALDDTKLKVKFKEHDLRAKTASDLDDIDKAQKLLGHTSKKTTALYMRKPQYVDPAR